MKKIVNPAHSKNAASSMIRLLLWVLVMSAAVTAISWPAFRHPFDVDSVHYIDMAEGRVHTVTKPFSGRIFHPLLAGTLARLTRLSIHQCFVALGICALVTLLVGMSYIARTLGSQELVVLAFMFTPLLAGLAGQYYLPDLLYAALAALFFLFMGRERLWLAAAMLFLLYATRESALLLGITVALVGAYTSRWRMVFATVAVSCLGIMASRWASSLGQPNIHSVSDSAYLVGKVVYNFAKNVLGIKLWTNTLAAKMAGTFPEAPQWKVAIPNGLGLGGIHEVGLYALAPEYPVKTLAALLTTFGALPLVLVMGLARGARSMLRRWKEQPMVLGALVYGGAAFVLGTSVGASVERLVGYGWPAFWIAVPVLLQECHRLEGPVLGRFLGYHAAICWGPFIMEEVGVRQPALMVGSVGLALALYVCVGVELRRLGVAGQTDTASPRDVIDRPCT